jgi:tRNA G18 (ribose-2'-O)-methylase SpoU
MLEHKPSYGFNILDEFKGLSLDDLKTISTEDRLPFAVLCLNLEHDLNIGNIIRTAHLLGAAHVFIVGNNKVDTRGCVGSQNYTNVIKYKIPEGQTVLDAIYMQAETYGYDLVFLEKNEASQDIRSIGNFLTSPSMSGHKICLVIGNEGKGIPEEVMAGRHVFHIPQHGVLRSLNASSAASIGLWEIYRSLTAE